MGICRLLPCPVLSSTALNWAGGLYCRMSYVLADSNCFFLLLLLLLAVLCWLFYWFILLTPILYFLILKKKKKETRRRKLHPGTSLSLLSSLFSLVCVCITGFFFWLLPGLCDGLAAMDGPKMASSSSSSSNCKVLLCSVLVPPFWVLVTFTLPRGYQKKKKKKRRALFKNIPSIALWSDCDDNKKKKRKKDEDDDDLPKDLVC